MTETGYVFLFLFGYCWLPLARNPFVRKTPDWLRGLQNPCICKVVSSKWVKYQFRVDCCNVLSGDTQPSFNKMSHAVISHLLTFVVNI